jgi:hypothetical protein
VNKSGSILGLAEKVFHQPFFTFGKKIEDKPFHSVLIIQQKCKEVELIVYNSLHLLLVKSLQMLFIRGFLPFSANPILFVFSQ